MSRSRTRSTIAFLPLTLVKTGHVQQRDAASRALHAASDHDRCARAEDLAVPRNQILVAMMDIYNRKMSANFYQKWQDGFVQKFP